MNLKALEYALILQRTGSFSTAAKEAGITQSAISQQISKLEEEVGFSLFERQGKPIRTSSDGRGFLQKAQSLLLEAEQLWDYAHEIGSSVHGQLRIGIIPTLAPYLTPFFIKELADIYPDLQLIIEELKSTDIIHGLNNRTLNAGILATPIHSSIKLIQRPLLYESFYLFTSPKHKLSKRKSIQIEEIDSKDLWLLNEGNCFSNQVKNLCATRLASRDSFDNLRYMTDSIEALKSIVVHSGGLTFIPELATLSISSEEEDLIKRITGDKAVREISMIYLKGEPSAQHLNLVGDVIQHSLPKRLHQAGMAKTLDSGIQL